ncbi:MAG: porin family protein [Myxococcales bacterium]|nr:porin family protein [Myxococcales bacterium]
MLKHALATIIVLASPSLASADPIVEAMGMRIGGYGFREATPASGEKPSGTGWQACRMNGLGIFANRGIGENFFVEGAFDTYFAGGFPTGEAMGTYDTPIDRSSALMTVAAGARFPNSTRFSPYLQVGLGAELTHVSLPALALEDTAILPMGFFGAGANLRITEKVQVGASLRVNAMGYYDDAQFQTELKPELEMATQGQFYASFAL